MVTQTNRLIAGLFFALLCASGVVRAGEKPMPPWDGKESSADYAKRAGLEPTLTLDVGGGVKLELVLIPAGKFMMGSPATEKERLVNETQHEVTLSQPYYMSQYLVTQEQYEKVMGANPSVFKAAKNPVEQISWSTAQDFCKKLSATSGKMVRLPTEAEWEYACRAGSTTADCFGDNENGLADYAWYAGNSGGTTHPVGEKKPNAWGLYDMHGNVWEWCQDLFGDYPASAATDPQGPAQGAHHVLRGGSWFTVAAGCRSAIRGIDLPVGRDAGFGGGVGVIRVVVGAVVNVQ